MKSIASVEEEIINEFSELPDVDAKYAHIFQIAAELQPMNPVWKTDENLVDGCQSKVWFKLHVQDGKIYLEADSDSNVIKGIAALLIRLVNGRQPKEIEQINLDFIDRIQIWKLPSKRNNGLLALLKNVKIQAAYYLKHETGDHRLGL